MKISRLRTKIILIGLPVLLVGALAFYVTSSIFIMPGFQDIENQLATKNADRAVDILTERLNQLNQKAATWGNSDETYEFMSNHNQTYIANELGNVTLDHLNIDYMLFFNTSGKLVEMKHVLIDSPSMISLPIGQGIKDLFVPNSPLLQHSSPTDVHKGVLITADGMIELVSRPIITSKGDGPIRGSVVFIKNMDTNVVQEMADITNLKLTFLSASDPSLTKSAPAFPSKTVKGTRWISQPSSMQTQAFTTIPDVFGKPSLAVRVDMPRTVTQEGHSTVRKFLLVSLLVGILLLVTTVLLLNSLIISRVLNLSKQLTNFKSIQDNARAVSVGGNDEITKLAVAINDLLVRLHNTYDLRKTNTSLENRVDKRTKALDDQLDQMKRINGLMVDRELRMKELKQQNAKLRTRLGDD